MADPKRTTQRTVRSVRNRASLGKSSEPALSRHKKSALECVRHDARSAAHTLRGFLELFVSGGLGPLSEEQRTAILHLSESAERLSDLTETSLDIVQSNQPFAPHELRRVVLSQLTQILVQSLSREAPDLTLSLELPSPEEPERATVLEPGAYAQLLRTLALVVSEHAGATLCVRISQTDLHTSLLILSPAELTDGGEPGITRSIPSHHAASRDLEAMCHAWRNRDYIRLKRCEALLARQHGTLLVAPDLKRVRAMLPLAHEPLIDRF